MNATLKNEGNTSTIRPDTGGVTTDSLAAKYKMLTRSSAVNIIELGQTVCQAKGLGEEALSEFCNVVNLDPRGSTYRKHLVIGTSAERFVPHIDRMPASWTTIYKLACLNDEDFEKIVENGAFSPAITAKDISEILGIVAERSCRGADEVTITLNLAPVSVEGRRDIYSEVKHLLHEIGFEEVDLELSPAMRDSLAPTARPSSTSPNVEQAASAA